MAEVVLKNVCKRFGDVVAVDDVNLTIADREFVVIVGPSGCGKTTILRMVAGLEEITGGEIRIGDRMVNDLAPKDRNIAMVFQSYALYPHMNVFNNIAYGLKMRKIPKPERESLISKAATILNIENLMHRKPGQLSGGQRQRVALGRAIVRDPDVFLFDEPLSNLDAKLRLQTRTELKKLHERLQATAIYVTHDQVEAMTMGNRIVVVNKGAIQQVGSPLTVYRHPANQFVAGFIGSPAMNFIPCRLRRKMDATVLDNGDFSIPLAPALGKRLQATGENEFIFGIRPEDIMENNHNTQLPVDYPSFKAGVHVIEPLGKEISIDINTGEHTMTALVSSDSKLRLNDTIEMVLNMDKSRIFRTTTGETIGPD
ncbi:MAG: sn-glycerol-3-phosphate ABC transporter ATP-binding protein UgpC [Desulfobacteraceae bacterium]|nr:sn-glycerol-3-phosphate ABC transporter ATP-binding protein UgpC [Desulfobacteraceae bacterium]